MHASSEPVPQDSVTELRTLGRISLWLLAFLPALLCGLEIRVHAVDVPVWDDWERAQLLEKHYAGELDLRYRDSAHIVHRSLVPSLLTLVLNGVTGGDLRAEMWVG